MVDAIIWVVLILAILSSILIIVGLGYIQRDNELRNPHQSQGELITIWMGILLLNIMIVALFLYLIFWSGPPETPEITYPALLLKQVGVIHQGPAESE